MPQLRPVDATADNVALALAAALTSDAPFVPLPADDPAGAGVALAMAQPELPPEVDDLAVVVATSGSTGTPKGVLLTRAAIAAAVHATHAQLGGPGEWTLALPPHYVAGLMVVARAEVAGTRWHRATPDLADLADTVPERDPDLPQYTSLVPTQLVRALVAIADGDTALRHQLAGFDAILLGGAAADPALLERAADVGLRVVTTYGMSETCGGCVYDGRPLPGVTVATDDGRLTVTGPMVFSGYRLRPDLTTAVLRRNTFLTSDRGEVTGGRVTVFGRLDDVVISGGVNVDLAEVERVVREVAGPDAEAVVLGLPDLEWGTRIVAVSRTPLTRADLGHRLTGARLPRAVVVLPDLPRTSTGKVDRQALAAEVASRG